MYVVIEHHAYFKKAQKLMTEEQMDEIVELVAKNPQIGEVIAGTGGIRKFRYAAKEGRGKSGGVRVIYLAITKKGVVHIIDVFGKNEKDNLSKADRNMMEKLVQVLKGRAT
jgi:mRNA-degrading endonuclease RelE of RelBE toxin-antitoxin system